MYDSALEMFDKAIQINSSTWENYQMKSIIYAIKRDNTDATQNIELALKNGLNDASLINDQPAFLEVKKMQDFQDVMKQYSN
jgi:Tfp pilus assembly protein PilF